MSPLIIASRFRGPEGSANGGYFAGMVAARAGRTVTVLPARAATHPAK